jgi:hypothetical protein
VLLKIAISPTTLLGQFRVVGEIACFTSVERVGFSIVLQSDHVAKDCEATHGKALYASLHFTDKYNRVGLRPGAFSEIGSDAVLSPACSTGSH